MVGVGERIDELMAAVDAVRALHRPTYTRVWHDAVFCIECNSPTPCPTVQALEGL